jgi:hypothetical protein
MNEENDLGVGPAGCYRKPLAQKGKVPEGLPARGNRNGDEWFCKIQTNINFEVLCTSKLEPSFQSLFVLLELIVPLQKMAPPFPMEPWHKQINGAQHLFEKGAGLSSLSGEEFQSGNLSGLRLWRRTGSVGSLQDADDVLMRRLARIGQAAHIL